MCLKQGNPSSPNLFIQRILVGLSHFKMMLIYVSISALPFRNGGSYDIPIRLNKPWLTISYIYFLEETD